MSDKWYTGLMSKQEIYEGIMALITEYYRRPKPRKTEIRTSDVLFDEKEALHLVKVLLSGWITQGPETSQFEKDFAEYYGVKHAIAVNSGSSANLMALASLCHESLGEARIKPGDEVITSPVTFPTSVFPIIQMGAVPVFVDVDPDTLCMDPSLVLDACTDKTKAILVVHLLGHPVDLEIFPGISGKARLEGSPEVWLIEDACESHGAMIGSKKVGSFGDFGTFSFFAAHHMTTGEGGMLTTNDDHLADLARSIRAFGRVIEVARDPKATQKLGERYKEISPKLGLFDVRQTFDKLGYALKTTDLQSAIGIEQLKKLDSFIDIRRANARYLLDELRQYEDVIQLPVEKPWAKHTYHHFFIIVREGAPFTRIDMVNHLEKNGIETRPIEAGNMADQPCMEGVKYRVKGDLTNARHIRENGFFIGCHPGLSVEDLKRIVNVFASFMEKYT